MPRLSAADSAPAPRIRPESRPSGRRRPAFRAIVNRVNRVTNVNRDIQDAQTAKGRQRHKPTRR
jgi:hypothetical protein